MRLDVEIQRLVGVQQSGQLVARIDIDNDPLCSGTIAPAISQLTSLRIFYLHNTNTSGTLPAAALGLLPNLNYLHVQTSRLSGQIPVALPALGLRRLVLQDLPRLSGTLPLQLGHLSSRLEHLVLARAPSLSGELPVELCSLTKLTHFEISRASRLSGTLPPELDRLTELRHLDVSFTAVAGALPREVGRLNETLAVILLSSTRLSGSLPTRALIQLGRLSKLYVDGTPLASLPPASSCPEGSSRIDSEGATSPLLAARPTVDCLSCDQACWSCSKPGCGSCTMPQDVCVACATGFIQNDTSGECVASSDCIGAWSPWSNCYQETEECVDGPCVLSVGYRKRIFSTQTPPTGLGAVCPATPQHQMCPLNTTRPPATGGPPPASLGSAANHGFSAPGPAGVAISPGLFAVVVIAALIVGAISSILVARWRIRKRDRRLHAYTAASALSTVECARIRNAEKIMV